MSIIVERVSFLSGGYRLLGRIYRPNTSGRFPAVTGILGFPGDYKLEDIAEEAALDGIVFLVFYWRGTFGSEGDWRFRDLEQQAEDAVAYLRSQPYVDSTRVGCVGFSFASVPLTRVLTMDTQLKTAVYVDATTGARWPSGWEDDQQVKEAFASVERTAKGKMRGLNIEEYRDDYTWFFENARPIELVKDVKVPVLAIRRIRDEDWERLVELAPKGSRFVVIESPSHFYPEERIPLINTILEWLREHL